MASRAGWMLLVSAGVAAAAVGWNVRAARGRHGTVRAEAGSAAARDPRRWPGDEATLTRPAASFTAGAAPIRVMIDPGHGAPNNHGNVGSLCVEEQDSMLQLAVALADRLEATGHVAARLSRDGGRLVEYPDRLEQAAAWGADAFVSLHSDVRGRVERGSQSTPEHDCPTALDAPGFAVLYSDERDPTLSTRSLSLGGAVARRMTEAGFLPYGGAAYVGIYAAEAEPGVFVDRHAPAQRIFVLRRAAMPSILVETHNALDPREAERWTDPDTLDAFAAAVAAALADATAPAFASSPRPGGT